MLRMRCCPAITAVLAALACAWAGAEIAVTVSPPRADVELLVYGNTDLTLVRETRTVSLPAGSAEIELSWPGAAVDATSVHLLAPEGVTVREAEQPAGKRDRLRWRIETAQAGPCDLQVTYLTSGIDWKPMYSIAVNEGTGDVTLSGTAALKNRSGQAFENARVELVVGELKLVENLAEAAWKALPEYKDEQKNPPSAAGSGLSEHYICDLGRVGDLTTEDTHTVEFLASTILPVGILYRLHAAKHGGGVHRILVVRNTDAQGLGSAPLLGAEARVSTVSASGLLPQGKVRVPYTPVGEECEVDLGVSDEVTAERRVMRRELTNIEYDRFSKVEGRDERESVELEVSNWSLRPISFEYTDTVAGVWDVVTTERHIEEGMNELVFETELQPQETRTLTYKLVKRHGRRVRLGPVRPK